MYTEASPKLVYFEFLTMQLLCQVGASRKLAITSEGLEVTNVYLEKIAMFEAYKKNRQAESYARKEVPYSGRELAYTTPAAIGALGTMAAMDVLPQYRPSKKTILAMAGLGAAGIAASRFDPKVKEHRDLREEAKSRYLVENK